MFFLKRWSVRLAVGSSRARLLVGEIGAIDIEEYTLTEDTVMIHRTPDEKWGSLIAEKHAYLFVIVTTSYLVGHFQRLVCLEDRQFFNGVKKIRPITEPGAAKRIGHAGGKLVHGDVLYIRKYQFRYQ